MIDVNDLIGISLDAGREIMRIYASGVDVAVKGDGSPVTEADERGEAVILKGLATLYPEIPVVAEESVAAGRVPRTDGAFFLVDPLDGTKEFIGRNGEFTVNIALIEDGVPTAGAVYAPAMGALYLGSMGGAERLKIADPQSGEVWARDHISVRAAPDELCAIGSRSHGSEATQRFLADYPIGEFVARGSSLKFCTLAAGEADIYPRFGRTMEWDTAAGDAVLRSAGGRVTTTGGANLQYNKRNQTDDSDFANPHFIAYADPSLCRA